MAIFHHSVKVITRSDNKNAVAAAAYRSASKIVGYFADRETGLVIEKIFDYTNKPNVVYSEILAPKNVASWVYDREQLWNAVEASEKRKDSQLSREVVLALPIELDKEQNVEILRQYVQENFVSKGMVADINVHWEDGNPHAHIMLSMRSLDENGFGKKIVEWNHKNNIVFWREAWANKINIHFKQQGIDSKVDHRSYKNQGIDLEATIHEGIADRIDGKAERIAINQEIREENAQRIVDNPEIVLDLVASKYHIFTQSDIAKEIFNILERSTSFNTNENFQLVLAKLLAHQRLCTVTESDIHNNKLYSLKEREAVEQDIWRSIEKMGSSIEALHNLNDNTIAKYLETPVGASHKLGELNLAQEQKDAIRHLTTPESLSVLIGRAGTGKSTVMKTLSTIYRENGYRIMGGAVSGIATDNLAQSCVKGEFRTLAGWDVFLNAEANLKHIDNKTVFIVDEASMVDIGNLSSIVSRICDVGAKLIIIGDPDQLQPIGVGGGFKAIVERVGAFELDVVWRQKDQWQREATINLANGKIKSAIKSYNERNCIVWKDTREQLRHQLVQSYVSDFINGDRGNIVLAYTRTEVAFLNTSIREHLITAGELVELNNAKGLYRSSEGIISVARGEQVVFTKNNASLGIYNGTRGVIEKISSSNDKLQGIISVRLVGEDRVVSIDTAEYNNFNYGYVTTIHKAQGLTANRSYILAEQYLNHNSFYVAASRHKESLKIFADRETFKGLNDLASKFGRTYKDRGLISEYDITPDKQAAYQKVLVYKSIKEEVADLYREMLRDSINCNVSFTEHDQYKYFLDKCKIRETISKNIYEDLGQYQTFLKQAGIDKNIIAKHAKIEGIYLSNRQLKNKEVSTSTVSEVEQITNAQNKETRISAIAKDLDNIIKSNEFIGSNKKREVALEIYNLETKLETHKIISDADIKNTVGMYKDIIKVNHLTNNSELYQSERQEAAFAITNSKHLFNASEFRNIKTLLVADHNEFISNYREPFKELNEVDKLSPAQMYAGLHTIGGNEKIKLAKALDDILNALAIKEQELVSELKITRDSILEADNKISVADYKAELLNNYFGKVYKREDLVLDRWQNLKQELSLDKAIIKVKEEFTILGETQGKKYLGIFEDINRKQAHALGITISNKLLAYEHDQQQKSEAVHILKGYKQEKTVLTLETDLSVTREQLGWIPNNPRIINEIRNEASKTLDFDKVSANTKEIKEEISFSRNHSLSMQRDFAKLDSDIDIANNTIKKFTNDIQNLKAIEPRIKNDLSIIYNDYPQAIIRNWNNLVKEQGLIIATENTTQHPNILGELRGKSKFLGLVNDKERNIAGSYAKSIGNDLHNFTSSKDKIENLNNSINKTREIETSHMLSADMPREQVNSLLFESQYKEHYFNHKTKPNYEHIQKMNDLCSAANKYTDRNPDLLNARTSNEIISCMRFEHNITKENYFDLTMQAHKSKEVLDISDVLTLKLRSEKISFLQTEHLLQDPTNKALAISEGREQFLELQGASNEISKTISQDNQLHQHSNMLANNIEAFVIEYNKLPDAQEQEQILELTAQENAYVSEIQNNLESYLEETIIDNEFTKDFRQDIAEYIVTRSKDQVNKNAEITITHELKKEIESLIKGNIKEHTNERELQKELENEMDIPM